MNPLKIAVAQFQPRDGDKKFNLEMIESLTRKASEQGADIISFHELSVTAYTFLKDLNREQLVEIAEPIPEGPSCHELIRIATKYQITVLAGLVETDKDKIFNTYVCADKGGIIARHRKIHPFISDYLSAGNDLTVFKIHDWTCGILICYDNNVIENVRATTLLGANIIFAPHVTGLTPSSMPGRGFVDDTIWQNRSNDPESLRREFDGPKGREWLMRWLPARAYDNGVYYVFSNPVGYDGEQLKNGNSMIIDPYGEVLTEIRSFENDITMAEITPEKLQKSGGFRYRNARRPEIYREILGKEHKSETRPVWLENKYENN